MPINQHAHEAIVKVKCNAKVLIVALNPWGQKWMFGCQDPKDYCVFSLCQARCDRVLRVVLLPAVVVVVVVTPRRRSRRWPRPASARCCWPCRSAGTSRGCGAGCNERTNSDVISLRKRLISVQPRGAAAAVALPVPGPGARPGPRLGRARPAEWGSSDSTSTASTANARLTWSGFWTPIASAACLGRLRRLRRRGPPPPA